MALVKNQITKTSIALARQGVNHIIKGNKILVQASKPKFKKDDKILYLGSPGIIRSYKGTRERLSKCS